LRVSSQVESNGDSRLGSLKWRRCLMPATTIRRALSIQQPWAELILMQKKDIEFRSRPTNILNERIYIYAYLKGPKNWKQVDPEDRKFVRRNYKVVLDKMEPGYTYVDVALLPRGYLVGTVEIVDCEEDLKRDDRFYWYLRGAK